MRRIGILIALLVLQQPAAAQEPEADALIKRGLELRRQHRDAEALESFRRAYAVAPTPRGRAQIALAEQALGRWLAAHDDLREAMAHADDAWIAKNRAVLEDARAAIEARLAWLEVSTDAVGAELWVNGDRRGALPLPAPVRVEAGSLVVEVRAPGYATASRITSVEPGGSAREDVHLVPLAPREVARTPARVAPSPPMTRDHDGDPRLRHVAIVVIGAGVVGLAAGTYFGVRTLQTKSQRDDHCTGQTCDSEGVALDQKARALAVRSTAWFGGALVAGGSGAVMLWVARSRRQEDGAFRLAPDVGADRAGVVLGGSF